MWVAVNENSQDLRALTNIRELQVSFDFHLIPVNGVEQILEIVLNDRLEKIIYSANIVPTLRPLLQPQALRELVFHNTDFQSTPAPSETFSSLTHLELVGCFHLTRLIDWLVLSNLISLTFQHSKGHNFAEDVRPLLSRIRFFSGLKHFILDCPDGISSYRSTFVAAIKAHKDSPESLLINNLDCSD